jgi:hypothetical protein
MGQIGCPEWSVTTNLGCSSWNPWPLKMAKIVVPKRRQLPIYAALHPRGAKISLTPRRKPATLCTMFERVSNSARLWEHNVSIPCQTMFEQYCWKVCNVCRFWWRHYGGECLYWFRLDAPSQQSKEYSNIIENYAEHVGRIFNKVTHCAKWCNVHLLVCLFVWLVNFPRARK